MTKRIDFELGFHRGDFLLGGYMIGWCRYDGRRIYDLRVEGTRGAKHASVYIHPLDLLYQPICAELRRSYAAELEAKNSINSVTPEPLGVT